jgi:predicted HicB family RNase H-like nuclease
MTDTMTYKDYTATMVVDVHDKVIVGRVVGIDDIIAFHGESIVDLEAHFQAAIDAYLAACDEVGSDADRPASGKLARRIPRNLPRLP